MRQAFDEALARASDMIGAQPDDLDRVPLLFSQHGGFNKRMQDVMAGKKASINLPAMLERFMRERFPSYRFETDHLGQMTFRRSLAPKLDLLLVVDRVHQWGLGKSFSLEIAAEYPGRGIARSASPLGGPRKNLFWLFHRGFEKRVWSYTTRAELVEALEGYAVLLERVLPVVEEQCRRLLVPLPKALPAGIAVQGALSAREGFAIARGLAEEWARDAELQGIGSSYLHSIDTARGVPIASLAHDGSLHATGAWKVTFLSKQLDTLCQYVVPHTGRVWWGTYSVLQGVIPKYSASVAADDWLDSTAVAPRALQAARSDLHGAAAEIVLALRDPTRYTGAFVWEATCMTYAGKKARRRDVVVQLDRHTGEAVASTVR